MGKVITAILAAIPAIESVLSLIDKWFGKSPAEKVVSKYRDAVKVRKEETDKIAKAVKEMKRGRHKAVQKILDR